VGDRDRCENGTKGSPSRCNFGLGVPDRAGLNQRRRKAVEGERDEASGVTAETARDVPQRRAQKDAAGEERESRQPSPVRCRFTGEVLRPSQQRRGGNEVEQRRMLSVETGVLGAEWILNDAACRV